MEYQALYRAWRPLSFSDMVGQEAVTRTLRRQVTTGHIAHAYLFCGTRGTGKTTAARVLSRAVNCLSPVNGDPCGECEACRALKENDVDIVEIDAASNNGVEDVRLLLDKVQYAPARVRYKVYIIDEVHMLSTGAFNALLKTLEEPPAHVVFILATTEPHKLPATILSRCQRYDFHRFRASEITGRLRTVLRGIGREAEDGALLEIARVSEGTMRDALNLLDVCLSYTDEKVTLEDAREVLGTAGRAAVSDYARALLLFDVPGAIACIDTLVRGGGDIELFARDASDRLRAMLMAQYLGDSLGEMLEITGEEADEIVSLSNGVPGEQLIRQADLLIKAEQDMKRAANPRTVLELATVRACLPERENDASLTERLRKLEELLKNGIAVKPAQESAPKQKDEPKAEKKPAPAAKAPAKGVEAPAAPAEYTAAIAELKQNEVSIARAMDEMHFAGLDGDTLKVSFAPRALMMQKMIESRKLPVLEAAFTKSFGRPVRVAVVKESDKPAQGLSRDMRDTIARAYELFDRENLEITD